MPIQSDRYIYRIIWSDEGKEYVGLCVEFPSLSWLAESPESALKGIREVVEDVIKFIVRIPPEVHRNLAIEAEEEGISLNRLVSAKLSR